VDLRSPDNQRPLKGGAVRAARIALKEGILVLPAGASGHVVELSPPLVVTEEQIEWAVTRLANIIGAAVAD
jgi:4-aminobutyrate aminotransferase-like enzyme